MEHYIIILFFSFIGKYDNRSKSLTITLSYDWGMFEGTMDETES